jgi:antitoxin (DNA-binding transcriptional repressor) of toxin-antitoxin stability system
MYHMTKASIRDLRYDFKKVERLLNRGEEIQITRRRRVIARLIPEAQKPAAEMPNFLERLRANYGDQILSPAGADLISEDRSRY